MTPRSALLALALAPLAGGCGLLFPQRPVEVPPPELHSSPSGVQFQDLAPGQGAGVQPGSTVTVHYTGWLANGTRFDSSHDRGRPITFTLGRGEVVAGWEEGMAGMRPGGVRRMTIPPHLAYGAQGLGQRIPPDSTLVLEVELLEVRGGLEPAQ